MLLRLFRFGLALKNLHHCQRVHKLYRGYELGSAGFVLGKLEDEHDLHGNIRFAVVKGAVGGGLGRWFVVSNISLPTNTNYLERDGAWVIYDIEDFELES